MARLTNRQMDVLSERVTDLLEEAHKANTTGVTSTPEYILFDSTFEDDFVREWRENAAKVAKIDEQTTALYKQKNIITTAANEKAKELGYLPANSYYTLSIPDMISRYVKRKKEEKFPNAEFNREKTLRRVQADILLSDVENPEQLVKSLVEKLK